MACIEFHLIERVFTRSTSLKIFDNSTITVCLKSFGIGGHAGLDQQPVLEQQFEQLCLFERLGKGESGHRHTSLAIVSRPASMLWMRSLATISRADSASRS